MPEVPRNPVRRGPTGLQSALRGALRATLYSVPENSLQALQIISPDVTTRCGRLCGG